MTCKPKENPIRKILGGKTTKNMILTLTHELEILQLKKGDFVRVLIEEKDGNKQIVIVRAAQQPQAEVSQNGVESLELDRRVEGESLNDRQRVSGEVSE